MKLQGDCTAQYNQWNMMKENHFDLKKKKTQQLLKSKSTGEPINM